MRVPCTEALLLAGWWDPCLQAVEVVILRKMFLVSIKLIIFNGACSFATTGLSGLVRIERP